MYPEWQKNIRQKQVERDEKVKLKEEAERKRREEIELRQRQQAEEQFAFVLSKLLGFPVSLSNHDRYVCIPYLFILCSVNEYTMRDVYYIDCTFNIERVGGIVP